VKINICNKDYEIESKVDNLLSILFDIKAHQNSALSFKSGCKSGVCGSCAVVVNGVERLACKTTIKDGDKVEPLRNSKIIKDLVVDNEMVEKYLQTVHTYLDDKSQTTITTADEKAIDVQSNCILCSSCFSSCPIYEVNKDFIAPFALVRAYRYVADKKESNIKEKLESVQTNGIWDCTLCGNCNMVCPEKIDIKGDIMKLRNISAQNGYSDPNFANNFGGFDSSNDFGGFNPNF
jgi:fumarate reductase iron-sulfur subunit